MSRSICTNCNGECCTDMGKTVCGVCLGTGYQTPGLDTLKARLAEKDAEIERLKRKAAFDLVETAGNIDNERTRADIAEAALKAATTGTASEAMVEAALAVDVSAIQGFTYSETHVIRDVALPADKDRLWVGPASTKDAAMMDEIERIKMRRRLTAAFLAAGTTDV